MKESRLLKVISTGLLVDISLGESSSTTTLAAVHKDRLIVGTWTMKNREKFQVEDDWTIHLEMEEGLKELREKLGATTNEFPLAEQDRFNAMRVSHGSDAEGSNGNLSPYDLDVIITLSRLRIELDYGYYQYKYSHLDRDRHLVALSDRIGGLLKNLRSPYVKLGLSTQA